LADGSEKMTTLNITVYTELKDDLLANAVRNAKTPKMSIYLSPPTAI
jgi:hypothetical protein